MPLYVYSHPKNPKKIVEVFQGMKDTHEYFDEKGVKWDRVWTKPEASFDTNADPFNAQAFAEKTARGTKQKMGDVWDRSAELSEKRAQQRDGEDPVKQKYYDDYAAKRCGKRSLKEIKEKVEKLTVEF